MFSRVRVAIRFFFVGLAVGVLLAPRKGEETRRLVREKAEGILNDVLDAASLGTVDTGARATDDVEADADAPTGGTRSTNGGRSRTKAASTSAPAG